MASTIKKWHSLWRGRGIRTADPCGGKLGIREYLIELKNGILLPHSLHLWLKL